MKGIAIIVAAGSGERAGVDKVWLEMGGKPMLERAAAPFFSCLTIDEIYLVVREARLREAEALFTGREKSCTVLAGGQTRGESVMKALFAAAERLGGEDAVVAIHDGARPYLTRRLIDECMSVAAKTGSAVPALPCNDSLRRVSAEGSRAIDRSEIYRVQTPQCFELSRLTEAYKRYGGAETDDATVYEKAYGAVTLTEGDPKNEKITYLSDIYKDISSRVGIGFDVHPLVRGRPCILGGIKIPHDKGPDGHSDADVLLHAIMDALLTAAGLPDIGHYFPPSDPAYAGADSAKLLSTVREKIEEKGYRAVNVSATVMAEKPKLSEHIPAMERRIAEILSLSEDCVTIAATTTERLGIVGEEKGIAAEAVALLGEYND